MDERKTISESKGLFHKEFPFVIPSLYRRVVDEYLVELNLLRNQKYFAEDRLFSYGLIKSFERFMTGYQPKNHVSKILKSLCNSCDFDYTVITNKLKELESIKEANASQELLISYIKESNTSNSSDQETTAIFKPNNYYSRIHAIGLYEFVSTVLTSKSNEKEIQDGCIEISNLVGTSEVKIRKDIDLYINNIKKLNESIKLLKLINKS